MARTFQSVVGLVLVLSSIGSILCWCLTKSNLLLIFPPIFFLAVTVQFACLLVWTVLAAPKFSSIRHLPLAPQKPWHKRLLKEPNAFHFERWINEVPNDGMIRYYGAFNVERVLLTSPRAVCEVMHLKAYDFEKQYSHKTHLKLLSGASLVTVEGHVHKFQRKTMKPLFWTRHVNESYYPAFWQKAGELANHMETLARVDVAHNDDKSSQIVGAGVKSMDDLISRTIFDIMGETAFGQDLKCLEVPEFFHEPSRELREAFSPTKRTRVRMVLGLILPAWIVDHLPIEFNRKARPGLETVKREGIELIRSKKASSLSKSRIAHDTRDLETVGSRHNSPARSKAFDLMGRLIDTNLFDDATLLDQFMMFHTGGTHTSIMAVKSAIWFLAQKKNLHMQRRLREEIRSVLPMPEPTTFDTNSFRSTPYLTAVRDEIFRLHSAFGTTGRQAIGPTEICGTVLPPGMPVSISPWAMHRSTEIWGADAKEFNPDRWLSNSRHQRPHENGSYISFGIGPRACIGEAFAKAEINCLLATIFGRFELAFIEGQEPPAVTHQVTVAFKEDVKVKITRIDGW